MQTISYKQAGKLPSKAECIPARILEIEIGQPLPILSAFDPKTNCHYQRAHCLIRLHTQPLGVLELQLPANGADPDTYSHFIWQALQGPINAHLQQDGLSTITSLTAMGITSTSTPVCIDAREQFLAHAPFVSVIVPTHDRPKALAICLNSLLSLHYSEYEIIVVDNAPSTNETADLLQDMTRSQAAPRIRYVREDRQGSSWARTRGMLEAQGEILAFADDDVVADPHWLAEIVMAFKHTDNVACVTSSMFPMELVTSAQFRVEDYGGFSKGFSKRSFDLQTRNPKTPLYPYTASDFGSGAGMAFTAAFLRSVGGFDPALGVCSPAQSGEDIAAFLQVITHGYTLVYTPAAVMYHHHRRDYAGLQKQIYGYGVGLTAYLTKSVIDNPWLLFDLLPKVPHGLLFILNDRAPHDSKRAQFPRDLTFLKWKGMLYGSFAYLLGRWQTRNTRKELITATKGESLYNQGKLAQ